MPYFISFKYSSLLRQDPAILEKKKKLAAIRAAKERLQAKLKENNIELPEVLERQEKEKMASEAPAANELPAKAFVVDLILSNLDQLAPKELEQLTEANTRVNQQYSRPVHYVVIQKMGPKPASPNAKTLSKFAALSRQLNEDNVNAMGDNEMTIPRTVVSESRRRVQWKGGIDFANSASRQSSPTVTKMMTPSKPCILEVM